MQIAKARDLKVAEDACRTHTSEWKGKKVGCFGHYPPVTGILLSAKGSVSGTMRTPLVNFSGRPSPAS
jgi:hypothetical protein